MKKKTLIVVDMQRDFIDGALGTKEAVAILPNVINKIKQYKESLTKRFLFLREKEGSILMI